MSDFKFSCPLCGQHIAGNEQWSGRRINCPTCQRDIVVPQIEGQVSSTPSPVVRVAPAAPPPAHHPPASTGATPPPRPMPPAAAPPPRRPAPSFQEEKGSKGRAIVTVAIVVIVLGVALFFLLPVINSMQNKLNTARAESAAESDGGEVGHITTLNRVLDETDPARYEKMAAKENAQMAKRNLRGKIGRTVAGSAATDPEDAPVIAPSWSLEAESAKIPASQVNGKLSGANFLAEESRLDINGPLHTLTIRRGDGLIGDQEVLVYLRLKPGETIQGKSWTVSKETRGAPVVGKRWKASSQGAPQFKTFAGGYGMKLEFAQASAGAIAGKIYLAFPDPEQTVVAGQFQADIRVATPGAPAGRKIPRSFGDE